MESILCIRFRRAGRLSRFGESDSGQEVFARSGSGGRGSADARMSADDGGFLSKDDAASCQPLKGVLCVTELTILSHAPAGLRHAIPNSRTMRYSSVLRMRKETGREANMRLTRGANIGSG
jgi:hypothetical protein